MNGSTLDFETLADDTIRTLNVPEPTFDKPLCIIMVGIPAAGKSTLSQKLSEKFPLTVFDEESLTSFLSPRATVFKRGSVEVFKLATKTIEHLLKQGKPCVYDANIKTRQQRDLIKRIVEECGGTYLLIYLNCPEDICYERLQKHNLAVTRGESKGFILDKDFFEYEVSSTSAPSPDEFNTVFNCNNPEDIFKITSQVESEIDKKGD